MILLGTSRNSEALLESFRLVHSYAHHESLEKLWANTVRVEIAIASVLWTAAVIERVRGTNSLVDGAIDVRSVLHLIRFAVSSLFLFALAFCVLYFCRALSCVVDSYCTVIITADGGLDVAVPRWTLVQALLRKVSTSVQSAMLVLQATVFFSSLMALVDVYQSDQSSAGYSLMLVPWSLVMLGISRVFFKAAEVTSRSGRVPSLINGCNFGHNFDRHRQYVVEYIVNSAAGFYMFEVRLTSTMTLKFAYVFAIGVFTLTTKIVSES